MKMKLLGLAVFCMISGSFACVNHCKDDTLAFELMSVDFFPNEEELKTLCPKVMTMFECERTFLECNGDSLEELATSSDKDDSTHAKILLAAIGLVRDLCDEDSSTHKDYIASRGCYLEFVTRADARTCRADIIEPVEQFIEDIYAGNEISPEMPNEMECLKNAYELVCIVHKLGDQCGNEAHRAATNALGRFKGLLGGRSCRNLENFADLKSRFLVFLYFNYGDSTSAREIFDLFKRKR